jgi:hypothetical protein
MWSPRRRRRRATPSASFLVWSPFRLSKKNSRWRRRDLRPNDTAQTSRRRPPKIAFNFHQSIQFSSIFFRAYHWVPKANNDTSEFGSQGWAVAELLMIKRPWLRIHRAKEDEMQVLAVLDPFSWRVGSLFRGIHEQAICRTEENKSWLIGFWGNF